MCTNLYKEFDDIIGSRTFMLQYAEENYEALLDNVKNNTLTIRYGKDDYCLGHFCPSLVMDKVTSGFKKERLLKSIPKGKEDYVIYELDSKGKLIRTQEINSFGTIFETYIIREDNKEFSVTILNGKKCEIVDSTRTIYMGERITRFDIIGAGHMWSEIYSYNVFDSTKINCKQYYYVPGLKGSNKSIPVGEVGSPIRLFDMEIEVDEKNAVAKIEYGEFINGKTEISYIYNKKI